MGVFPANFLVRAQSSGRDADNLPDDEEPVTPIRDTTYMKESATDAKDWRRAMEVAGATNGT
jgi:hypothetical protein